MFKNYFIVAWRNIVKNRFYSIVNIAGLAAGLLFTIVIGAYVWSEWQVNADLKNAGEQYIIKSKWKDPNMGYEVATPAPLAKALKEQYPHLVANYFRMDGFTSNVSNGDKFFREGIQFCDSTILAMYGFSLLYGDMATAFSDPWAVIITENRAIKYFGKKDVVGNTLTIESFSGTKRPFLITGVMKDHSKNSITAITSDWYNELYIPVESMNFFGRDFTNWQNLNCISYVQLNKNISPAALQKPLQQLIKTNTLAGISENMTAYLVPLKEYYRGSNNGLVRKIINALLAIALFILLMAVINFINLAIGRSGTRLKEIGVRKALGGLKKQLVWQFLTESMLLTTAATIIACTIYIASKDLFGELLGKDLPQLSHFPVSFIAIPVVLIILVGLMAGLYPAFVLSSFNAIHALKGKAGTIKEKIGLRKSLVGFQFGVATIVFVGAIIISKQIDLFFSKDIGYDKEYIISAQVPRDWSARGVQRLETIRDAFTQFGLVSNATLSFEIPDGNNSGSAFMFKKGQSFSEGITVQSVVADENYATTFQIPLLAGRFFYDPHSAYDSTKIVLNEKAAKALGWSAGEAVGNEVTISGLNQTFTIAGVVKDFHFGSMQSNIQPVWFINVRNQGIYRYLSFKLKPGNIERSIEAIQKKWAVLLPGAPFEYTFMDDTLARLYKTEIQLKKAAYTATVLAFIIVLLGVLGLISLSVQKRTKEIGIRKVLGSSVTGIMVLFIKEFLLVVCIAGVVACPVAYIIMHTWLNEYAYRIAVTAQPFFIAILLLAIVTGLLICIQTIKAALANPSRALRSE